VNFSQNLSALIPNLPLPELPTCTHYALQTQPQQYNDYQAYISLVWTTFLIFNFVSTLPVKCKWSNETANQTRIKRSLKLSFTLFLDHPIYFNTSATHRGKSVPLQAWSGPEGSRKLRFPDFMTTALESGTVVTVTHRLHLPPGNPPGTQFC